MRRERRVSRFFNPLNILFLASKKMPRPKAVPLRPASKKVAKKATEKVTRPRIATPRNGLLLLEKYSELYKVLGTSTSRDFRRKVRFHFPFISFVSRCEKPAKTGREAHPRKKFRVKIPRNLLKRTKKPIGFSTIFFSHTVLIQDSGSVYSNIFSDCADWPTCFSGFSTGTVFFFD